MTLTELADRVEGLTGPCRETDAMIDIACRVGPGAGFPTWVYTNFPIWRTRAGGRVEVVHHDGTGGVHWTPKPFTSSFDCAMSLVLEDIEWEAGTAKLMDIGWARVVAIHDQWKSKASTPTLALTAASLRARASMEADRGT
jgi:hypothetical protein